MCPENTILTENKKRYYKKDGNKFLKKRLRENELKDLGNYDKPAETIKWDLANLVNKMEGRPRI